MSEQEKFLARWSRRKLEPAEEKAPAPPPEADAPAPQAAAAPVPEFDLSKLPSLDSIGADSDIKAFLQAGVPSALRHAALRRAWSADPAIRDYIGPNENFWDAAGLDGAPGFGALDPSVDVKKLVAEVFGNAEPEPQARADAPENEQSAAKTDVAASDSVSAKPRQSVAANDPLLQRDKDIASQQDESPEKEAATKTRRHGGAMPC